jgi:hypothetical protein
MWSGSMIAVMMGLSEEIFLDEDEVLVGFEVGMG